MPAFWLVLALLVLASEAAALQFARHGKTVAFDLHRQPRLQPRMRKRDGGTLSAPAILDPTGAWDYAMNFTLGTPGQPMSAFLDTGSSDFWIPATGSSTCAMGCPHGSFDPSKSSTYTLTEKGALDNTYGDGSGAVGDFGTDVLQFQGTTLTNFTIGVSNSGHVQRPTIGIIGLGMWTLESEARKDGVYHPTIVDALFDAGHIESHTLSLYYNEENSTGSILFGGVDTAKFQGELGIVDVLPIPGGEYVEYAVPLSGVSFTAPDGSTSQVEFAISNSYATLLDSGAATIELPNEIAYGIYQGLGLEYSPSKGAIIACDAAVSNYMLNFTLGGSQGVNIGIPLTNLIQPYVPGMINRTINGDRACVFSIAPLASLPDNAGFALLGAPFLRGAYTVYDRDNLQLAFAPAIPNVSSSNVIAISGAASITPTAAVPSSAAATLSAIQSALASDYGVAYPTAVASGYGSTSEDNGDNEDEIDANGAAAAATTNAAIATSTPNAGEYNTIPSATTASGSPSVMYITTISTPPGGVSVTTPSPTFKGMPTSGLTLTATIASGTSTKGAAAGLTIPTWQWSGMLVAGVTLWLMGLGGGILTM